MSIDNKRLLFIISGVLLVVVLVVGIVLYGAYQKEKQIEESIKEFDEQRPIIMEESKIAKVDFKKALTFIEKHLPFGIQGYDSFSTPVNYEGDPKELTTYFFESALLDEDVSQWITYFTSEASSGVMNQLQGETLEERIQELIGYVDRMTRGGTLTKVSGYELDEQYYFLFQYKDEVEVEVPIKFMVVEDEALIATDILNILERIKKASSEKQ
ncbi:hypothetical protein D7X33_19375 [Butyricicoccus sp. 1XD8-22]|nr:hypothetical protein D7X33_19375 [Butyricicoccus sp. 1XD8-22]